jgi:fucose permease
MCIGSFFLIGIAHNVADVMLHKKKQTFDKSKICYVKKVNRVNLLFFINGVNRIDCVLI